MTEPSKEALSVAVELEIEGCIGRITTRALALKLDKIATIERQRCAHIALAIDSGRGNEKMIAAAILAEPMADIGDSRRPSAHIPDPFQRS